MQHHSTFQGPFDTNAKRNVDIRMRRSRTLRIVCAPAVHTKSHIQCSMSRRTAVVQPYLSACFGPSSGPFNNNINWLARFLVRPEPFDANIGSLACVCVRKECADVPRTQGNVCVPSDHMMSASSTATSSTACRRCRCRRCRCRRCR